MKISVLSMTEDPNISVFCQFPFSWVLKAYLDDIWEKAYLMKGNISRKIMNPTKLPKICVLQRTSHRNGFHSRMTQNCIVHLFGVLSQWRHGHLWPCT